MFTQHLKATVCRTIKCFPLPVTDVQRQVKPSDVWEDYSNGTVQQWQRHVLQDVNICSEYTMLGIKKNLRHWQ